MTQDLTDRQLQIIEAAIALFLRDGVGVSTASIAKAAGVSNGTLFNAFATKQALIDTIYCLTKREMFEALPADKSAPLTKAAIRTNWDGYFDWARSAPAHREIMHLLLDAGLASAEARAEIDALAAPHAAWMTQAWMAGTIQGPSVAFISGLIFHYLDLVLTEHLTGDDEALAFDMLCKSIGLTT